MNLSGIACLSYSALISFSALAGPDFSYDYGTVIESVPIVKNIRISTPREECWDQEVVHRARHGDDGVSTVVGALVGGAIGNAVGHSNKNKKVGAVLGAVLGGTLGSSIAHQNRSHPVYETEEVCETIHEYHQEERVVGYRVRYRFNNETYTTRTDTDPGDTIKLRLAVSPVN